MATNNKEKYLLVINHLEQAVKLLEQIKKADPQEWDASHFQHQIEDVLSCDSGEVGLKPYLSRRYML